MAYVTICKECLDKDCANCGKGELEPERKRIQKFNDEHPDGFLCGGGICVCGHGKRRALLSRV